MQHFSIWYTSKNAASSFRGHKTSQEILPPAVLQLFLWVECSHCSLFYMHSTCHWKRRKKDTLSGVIYPADLMLHNDEYIISKICLLLLCFLLIKIFEVYSNQIQEWLSKAQTFPKIKFWSLSLVKNPGKLMFSLRAKVKWNRSWKKSYEQKLQFHD